MPIGGQGPAGIAGMGGGFCGFSTNSMTRPASSTPMTPNSRASLMGTSMQATGHVGALTGMLGQHAAVVHLVDVVAGNDQECAPAGSGAGNAGSGRRHRPSLDTTGFVDLLLGGSNWMNSSKRPSRKLQPRWMWRIRLCACTACGQPIFECAGIDAVGER